MSRGLSGMAQIMLLTHSGCMILLLAPFLHVMLAGSFPLLTPTQICVPAGGLGSSGVLPGLFLHQH